MSNEAGHGIECANCKSKIYSTSRNNMKCCKCGDCFVDGGYDYLRFGYRDKREVRVIDQDGKPVVFKPEEDENA